MKKNGIFVKKSLGSAETQEFFLGLRMWGDVYRVLGTSRDVGGFDGLQGSLRLLQGGTGSLQLRLCYRLVSLTTQPSHACTISGKRIEIKTS